MGRGFLIPLTNSKGLSRVIFFSGLDRPIVVYPALLDTPLLTAQPFYFLSQVDCVAKVRFEDSEYDAFPSNSAREWYVDRLLDNYLFRFSRLHPDLAVTAKMPAPIMHPDMTDDIHFGFDHCTVSCLAIDQWNDDAVESFSVGGVSKGEFGNHVLISELIEADRQRYVSTLERSLRERVTITAKNHPYFGTGTIRLPIARLAEKPITTERLDLLDVLGPTERRNKRAKTIRVSRGFGSKAAVFLKEEVSASDQYDPELLAYYFCGLRDHAPIAKFKNLYNVLECFFDAADGKKEVDQLIGVLRRANRTGRLKRRLRSLFSSRGKPRELSTHGTMIPAFPTSSPNLLRDYGRRLYAIRNACLHSKRLRNGSAPLRIIPTVNEDVLLKDELPFVQEIAAIAIEALGRAST